MIWPGNTLKKSFNTLKIEKGKNKNYSLLDVMLGYILVCELFARVSPNVCKSAGKAKSQRRREGHHTVVYKSDSFMAHR